MGKLSKVRIPKLLHYVWLGGKPETELTRQCVKSWKKHCPDYEIQRWDESNFDLESNQFCREAHANGVYAFSSDYMRLKTLADHGGIYMDTDVEVVRNLDKFLELSGFMGLEAPPIKIGSCVIGAEKGNDLIEEWLSTYEDVSFRNQDGTFNMTPNTNTISSIARSRYHNLKLDNTVEHFDDMSLFPVDYFSPFNRHTHELSVTENTHSIHHFAGSWLGFREKNNEMLRSLGKEQ